MQRRHAILLAVGGVSAAVLFGCGLLGVFVWFAVHGVSSRPPTEGEKQLLVTVDDLEPFGIEVGDKSLCEKFEAHRNLDGTTEVDYEYDADSDPASKEKLWLSSDVTFDGSASSASESFHLQIAALKLGTKLGSEAVLEQRDELFRLGDQRYAAIIKSKEGNPAGNIVVVRKGNVVYSMVVAGIYFDNAEDLESLLGPKMKASNYRDVKPAQ